MEEIDIIELLKRVKEGKAPKKIEIDNYIFEFDEKTECIEVLYNNVDYSSSIVETWFDLDILFDTKIKILDKPIIEEIHKTYDVNNPKELKECVEDLGGKINEIIRQVNRENEDKE